MDKPSAVLLVENDDTVRTLLRDVLEEAGFGVAVASGGPEAVEILTDRGRSFRALVTAIDLGAGPDGWAVARHARRIAPGVPVLYVTARRAHEWPADGVPHSKVLQKPFPPGTLVQAVMALLAVPEGQGA